MKSTNKLKDILKDYLNWDKRRIDCFVKMLISLIAVQTVNLARLANYMGKNTTNIAVRYRRLQRFFQHIKIDYNVIAIFIFRLFEFDKHEFFLTMDRTN